MPAEWEHHTATWLAWPYDEITFPERIARVEKVFAEIIYHLHHNERVELLVLNDEMQRHAEQILAERGCITNNRSKINFHIVDYADVWLRDYGPTFLCGHNSETNNRAWVKWQYNAYGAKFPDLLKDNDVPHQLKDYLAQPIFAANLLMEGGAIDVNGEGTVITTAECLLNPNRNRHMSKEEIENKLKNYLGANKIIWLEKGLVNDHTDGHIDEIARFVDKNTLVCAYTDDTNDPNFSILGNNWHTLSQATDHNGRPFNLIKLPLPQLNYDDGEPAPVSYTNFYVANNLVITPQFNHANDKIALQILEKIFPGRRVIGVDCTDLIYGGGAIHCITQQQP